MEDIVNYLYGLLYVIAIYIFNYILMNSDFFSINIFIMSLYISLVSISIFMMYRHYSEVRAICYSSLTKVRFFSTIKIIALACVSSVTAIFYCVNISLYSCNVVDDWRVAACLPIILFVSTMVCHKFYKEWGKRSKAIQKSIISIACISALIVSCISVSNFYKINESFSEKEKSLNEAIRDLGFSSILSNVIPFYGIYSGIKVYKRYSDLEDGKRKYNPYYTTFGDVSTAACTLPKKSSFIIFIKRIVVFFDVFFNWLANYLGGFGLCIMFIQEFLGEFSLASIYCIQLMLWCVPFGSVHKKYCEVYGKDPVSIKKFYVSNIKVFVLIYFFVFSVLNITLGS